MMPTPLLKICTDTSPGEFRAVAIDPDGRAVRLFSERWSGEGARTRFGMVVDARLRAFADQLRGAFCELSTGEKVFLRLKSRDGLTEGMTLRVRVLSEARREKLARVAISDQEISKVTAFQAWRRDLGLSNEDAEIENSEAVTSATEEALSSSITLFGGGRIHIDRTRALTAFDIDTAGRLGKGSAAARALSINRDAVQDVARQISLRGLGGLFVMDCISPLNSETSERVRAAASLAFEQYGLLDGRVLKPSALGLLEASAPWRYMPLEDERDANPAETELLGLLRDVQREAIATPVKFYNLSLCGRVWKAYLTRKSETDQALHAQFGGRVLVGESSAQENKVLSQ